MFDVVRAIDGDKSLFECREIRQRMALFADKPPAWVCDGPCGVRSVMDNAQQRMEEELARSTILDLSRVMFRKAPESFPIEVNAWLGERRSGKVVRVSDTE